jgi:predicted Zn finger-like uncharacterized protein
MRLICPNCDAQYEVDDAAIPAAGRDVQCSSCGHGWFQTHPEIEAERAAESALHDAPPTDAPIHAPATVDTPPPVDTPAPVDAPVAEEPEAVVVQDVRTEIVADNPADTDAEVVADTPAEIVAETVAESPTDTTTGPPADTAADADTDADSALQSRQIDEAVLAVLREEAEREMIARRLDAQAAVETQADLGIDDVGLSLPPTAASARHIALLKGEDPDAEPEVKRELSRREMLPDIEEINSSLRPGDVAVGDDGETFEIVQRPAPRSGFRSGFVLMLVLAIAVVALYVMAPRIAEQIPGAKPALDSYVAAVDTARVWLDQTTRSLISGLQGLAGGDEPPAP